MGENRKIKKEQKVISDACEYIYKKIDKIFPQDKKRLEEETENNLRKQEGELSAVTLTRLDGIKKDKVKSWVRDKVINDYNYVTSIIDKKFLLNAKKKERNNFFAFFARVRNSSLERFYNADIKQENALKSINAFLKSGKLQYNYEKLCDDFLQIMYTDDYTKDYLFELIPQITNIKVQDLEKAKIDFLNSFLYKREIVIEMWNALLDSLWDMYSSIRALESSADKRVLGAIRYVDFISGIIRDVLSVFSWISMELSKSTPEAIANQYINLVQKYLDSPVKLERSKYPLFENYLVHISMISLIGERKEWISMQSFLLQEVLDKVKPKKTDKYKKKEKMEQTRMILKWYIHDRKMRLPVSDATLISAAYTECFMYKKFPDNFKRHGINHFIKRITEKKESLGLNMDKEEMFYYLKILRGIAREQEQLEWYIKKEQMLISIYKMEMEMYGKIDSDGFMGIWAEAMIYAIAEVGKTVL